MTTLTTTDPHATWTIEQLTTAALRAIKSCRRHGQEAARSAWEAGAYLGVIRDRTKAEKKWTAWLEDHVDHIDDETARRYIHLFLRSGGDVSRLPGMDLTEAYRHYGILPSQVEKETRTPDVTVHRAGMSPAEVEEETLAAAGEIRPRRERGNGRRKTGPTPRQIRQCLFTWIANQTGLPEEEALDFVHHHAQPLLHHLRTTIEDYAKEHGKRNGKWVDRGEPDLLPLKNRRGADGSQ